MNTKTKQLLSLLILLCCCFDLMAQDKQRVLIFTKTSGYSHASIPDGVKAVQKIAQENNFIADTTSNGAWFTEENLKKYSALIFISTNPRLLDSTQKTEFARFIQAGGGFVGIHGASAAGKAWPWYNKLVGASFINHPEPKEALLKNENTEHESTRHFPNQLLWKDEWYNFSDIQEGLNVLLSVDEASYVGGENGRRHPISWYRAFDGGRSFYTALGHFSFHYTDALFVNHMVAGIKYAMGDNVKLDYSKASIPKYTGK